MFLKKILKRNIKKGGSLLHQKPKVTRYRFIKAESVNYRLTKLCELLRVKRSSYYAWDKRPESKRNKRRKELTDRRGTVVA